MIKEIKQEKTANEIAQDLLDKIPDKYNLCIKCDYESKIDKDIHDYESFIFSILIEDDLDNIYNYIEDLYLYLINNFNFVPIKIKKYIDSSSNPFGYPGNIHEYYNIGYIKLTDVIRILYGGNIMKVEESPLWFWFYIQYNI